MSFNNPIRFFRDPAADQAALNAQLQITNQLQGINNTELSEAEELALGIKNTFRGITAELTELINNQLKKTKGEFKSIGLGIKKDIVGSLKEQSKESQRLIALQEKQKNGSLKTAEVDERIAKTKEKQRNITYALEEAVREGIITQDAANKRLEIATGEYNKQKKALNDMRVKAEEFEKKLGITYKIFDGINKIPILNSLIKIDKVKESMEEAAASGKSTWGVFSSGISSTFSQIGKSLKDPLVIATAILGIFKKLYDLTVEYDAALVKTGRTLALNREQTEKLYERSAAYAQTQHDSFVTTKRLFEAQTQLNEALGTSVTFSDKSAESFAKLTHYYGLSAESAAKLEELGQVNKGTSETIKKTILATAGAQKLLTGASMSYPKILDKVANISSDIYIKFKGNVKAITEAVMQADRLGLSLEQVDQIGESLLNFESSIDNELKAELLTGKAINLEKARSAALSGDTAKLTQEIVSQVGNIHEFERMNVIQRKAYAEAFGMNVKDMSEMLRKQEFQAALGDKVKASAEEQLKYAKEHGIAMSDAIQQELERKSLADEQKEIMDKLKDVLMKITSGPMKAFAHMMEKVLGSVVGIIEGFGKITGGGLGSALGAGLLAIPAILAVTRLAMGSAKSLFFNGMSPATAPWMRVANPGAMGGLTGPGGAGGTFYKGGQFLPGGGRAPAGGVTIPNAAAGGGRGGFMGRMGGNMKMGGGLALGGMALSGIASGMDEGGGKDAIGVLGQTATYAGMGMMFGPIGGAIGGLVGLGMGLFNLSKENEERRKADTAKKNEDDKKYQSMVEALSVRPLQLNVGNESVAKFSTQQSLTNSNPNYP